MSAAYPIFAAAYIVLAVGRAPGLRVDRSGAAIIGAALMIAAGVLTPGEAWRAIDYQTLMLLFGMMIVVANLRFSGFFTALSAWVVEHAHHPLLLLSGIVLVAGVSSAFFVNDTMCLVLTPLVLEITRPRTSEAPPQAPRNGARHNPVPYLLAVAMAANVGSAATITGNPQNMMIGSFSGIPYRAFAAALSPVAAAGLGLTVAVIALVYREEFRGGRRFEVPRRRVRVHRALLGKSIAAAAGMLACFFAGVPVANAAFVAGALLLISRRVKPARIYAEIDWGLLMMFTGLFVVVGGIENTALPGALFTFAGRYGLDRTAPLAMFAALLSNLVSNVPAVLVFRSMVPRLPDPAHAWLTLAMSSTLAGNLTLPGSVANLIVIERARREVQIGFWEYAKAGVPLALATLAVGIWMLG